MIECGNIIYHRLKARVHDDVIHSLRSVDFRNKVWDRFDSNRRRNCLHSIGTELSEKQK